VNSRQEHRILENEAVGTWLQTSGAEGSCENRIIAGCNNLTKVISGINAIYAVLCMMIPGDNAGSSS